MIKEVHVVKGAPQLKSVAIHDGSIMGVTQTDEIIILGYLPVSKTSTVDAETQSFVVKPKRGRKPKNVSLSPSNGQDDKVASYAAQASASFKS